jgi:hypothetical protein
MTAAAVVKRPTWTWPSRRCGGFNFRSMVRTFEFIAPDAYLDREYFVPVLNGLDRHYGK